MTLTITYFAEPSAFEVFTENPADFVPVDFAPDGSSVTFSGGWRIAFERPAGDGTFDGYTLFAPGGEPLVGLSGLSGFFTGGGAGEVIIEYAGGDTEVVGFDFLTDLPQVDLGGVGDGASIDFGDGTDTIDLSGVGRSDLVEVVREDGTVTVTSGDESYTFRGLDRIELDGGTYLYGLEGDRLDYVYALYRSALGRTPDEDGLVFWNGVAQDPAVTDEMLAQEFVDSPEFASLFAGEVSDAQFVDRLYNVVLGREEDQEGFDFWLGVIETGDYSRAEMLNFFVNSPEYFSNFAEDIDDGIWVT